MKRYIAYLDLIAGKLIPEERKGFYLKAYEIYKDLDVIDNHDKLMVHLREKMRQYGVSDEEIDELNKI